LQGQEVSKDKYQSAKDQTSGRLTYTESKWDGSVWADEITCYESSASKTPAAGRPVFRIFADGTAETITYALVNGQLKIAVSRGDNSTGTLTQPVITAGTRTTTLYNATNTEISMEVHDIASNLLLSMETGVEFDVSGRVTKKVFNANFDDYEISRYGCCGLEFSRDRSGATQDFFRDNLKRVHRVVSKSSSADDAISTFTSYNGLTTRTTRSDGTTTLLVSEIIETLDGLTRTTKSPDADGDGNPETTTQVTVRNPSTGSTHTTTHPDGTTSSSQDFLDGSEKSSTDQAGNTTTYDKATHALNGGGIITQTTAANGTQWEKSYSDPLGRTIRTELADGATSTATYHTFTATLGSRGKMASATDPDGITVSYAYNAEGEQTETTRPMPGGQQQLTQTASDVINDPSIGVALRSRQTLNGTLISTSLRSGNGYRSKSINHLATNAISTSTRSVPNDGAWTVTSTAPDGPKSVATYTKGQMTRQETFATDNSSLGFTTMSYDKLDRLITSVDARTGTTTMGAYLENGTVTSVTEPGDRTTTFTYDQMGRTLTTDAPDSLDASGQTLTNITHTSYTPTGQVAGTWGAQTNPTFRIYDSLERMVELRTYQNLAANTQPVFSTTGFATTTWIYSPDRGHLTAKRDAADKGANYTYTPGGRLKTRTWARGITTTYEYDAGMLTLTDYSDTTPDVSMEYDALGRPASSSTLITDHSAPITSSTFTYNPTTLLLDTETITYTLPGQPAFTRVLDRSQDTLLRDSGWVLGSTPASGVGGGASPPPELVTSYAYNPTHGRLETIRGGGLHPPSQFNYSYLANSNLIKTITSPAHTVTNTYEPNRDVLDVKENKAGTTIISKHDYLVNAIGQRSNLAQTGTAFATAFAAARDIAWGYDPLGQVTSADSTIPGLDRAYAFDLIGNRLRAATGSIDPNDPAAATYTPTALNQYSSINNQSSIINPQFDTDGNMTSGPLPANVNANSALVWDGENRLIQATVGTTGSVVRYSYDSQSRRIAETVGTNTKITVYDGWNPIAEYAIQNSTFTIQNSYLWGIDLSGTLQGAGGVGGLLMTSLITNNSITSNYFPTYDGTGNVSEYLNESGEVSAHYEYDPFGKTTVATGAKASQFSHRFSTKPLDATTGLYYYGYRFYDPNTGRWPSRDPIEERGGVNLYGFCYNSPPQFIDSDGRIIIPLVAGALAAWGGWELGSALDRLFQAAVKAQESTIERQQKKQEVEDNLSDPDCPSDELEESMEEYEGRIFSSSE
jgi:RHS repeat-associated protein